MQSNLIFALALLAMAPQTPGPKPKTDSWQPRSKVLSVVVNVVGQSYVGITHGRSVNLNRYDNEYEVDYSCYSRGPGKRCWCKGFSAPLKKSTAEQFLLDVEGAKDQGTAAQCCDHPYTTVEITYEKGRRKTLTLAGDLLDRYEKQIEKTQTIFGLACNGLPVPRTN